MRTEGAVLTIAVCFVVLLLVVDVSLVINRQILIVNQGKVVNALQLEIERVQDWQDTQNGETEKVEADAIKAKRQVVALVKILRQVKECRRMSEVQELLAKTGL